MHDWHVHEVRVGQLMSSLVNFRTTVRSLVIWTVLPFLPRFHRAVDFIRDSQPRIIPPCGQNIYFPSYFHVTSLLTEHYVKKKRCDTDDRASNRKKRRERKQEKRPDKWSWNFQQPDCRSSYQKDSLKWKKGTENHGKCARADVADCVLRRKMIFSLWF